MPEGRSFARPAAAVTALFVTFWTAAMLWPALRAPRNHIVMDIGDPALNAAILQWNARTLPLTREWWNFPSYAPAEGVTAFTEHLLGVYPLSTPLIWVTGNPVFAYNLLCLLSFPLTALAMFALGHRLTASAAGAAVAALAFTFSPYRVSHLSHLQMLLTFGMPVALLGLHEWVDRRARRGLLLFAAGWLFTAASNGYLMVFFGVYLAFWVAWFCSTRETIRRVPAIAITGAIATLPLVPVLLGYMRIHREYQLRRGFHEVASYGADIAGILHPWPALPLPSIWFDERYGEGSIFPGVAIVVLAVLGTVLGARHTAPGRTAPRRVSAIACGAAFVFFAAAAIAAQTDLRYEFFGLRLSLTRAARPLTLGLVALVIAAGTSVRLRRAFSSRSPVVFHVLVVFAMWLLSLGPVGRLNGVEVVPDLPYKWLLDIPGMMALRVPARFWLMAILSLAVLAGYGAAKLASRRATRAVLAIAAAIMLAESWPGASGDPIDPFPDVVPLSADAGPVLEMPFDRLDANTPAMLRATTGGYRTMNGYSGFAPPHFAPLQFGLFLRDGSVLTELRRRFPFHVSVRRDDSDGLRTWLTRTHDDARLVAEGRERALYSLSKLNFDPPEPGRPVPFTGHRASCGHPLMPDVADGNLETRWECGRNRPGEYVEVDLGRVTTVSGVVNGLGPYTTDSPRNLQVSTSTNGTDWTVVWHGMTAAAALRAAFTDPIRMDVEIRFPPVKARYVRLLQTGDEVEQFWSIAELKVLGE